MTALSAVIGRGLHSARPAAGTAGELYYETDTGQLFRDSGSTWQLVDLSGLITAKGDLLVGTGSGTVAKLAVGSDTQVLTADSTQAGGIKWAAAGGGGGITKTDLGTTSVGGSTEAASGACQIYCKQVTPGSDGLIAAVRASIVSDGSHTSIIGAAIYDDNAGVPRNVIANSGYFNSTANSLNLNSTARFFEVPIAYWATSGTPIWLAILLSGATSTTLSIAYATSGSDYKFSPSASYFPDASIVAPSSTSRNYSIACRLLH